MPYISILIALAALLVGATNGANDNAKGVATLLGCQTLSYRPAIALATAATLAGSLAAAWVALGLVGTFQGKGLVPDAVTRDPSFVLAVALGTAGTVLLATAGGFPISTTHALLGALAGAGAVAAGRDLRLATLASSFVLPLLASPAMGAVLVMVLYPLFRRARIALGVEKTTCVCVGGTFVPVSMPVAAGAAAAATMTPSTGAAASAGSPLTPATAPLVLPAAITPGHGVKVSVGTQSQCVERYAGQLVGVSAAGALDTVHIASGALVSFARGLNDTPKIVALLLAAGVMGERIGFAAIAVAMAAGALVGARPVARTMSREITSMNTGQGFTANLVTALLVTLASRAGLPVSTTHVSCGALFGLGAVTGQARADTIRSILLAWVTTLPVAAGVAAAALVVLRAS